MTIKKQQQKEPDETMTMQNKLLVLKLQQNFFKSITAPALLELSKESPQA